MRRLVTEAKGGAYALLILLETAVDAVLGPKCLRCPDRPRVFPRDQYAHNLRNHR